MCVYLYNVTKNLKKKVLIVINLKTMVGKKTQTQNNK